MITGERYYIWYGTNKPTIKIQGTYKGRSYPLRTCHAAVSVVYRLAVPECDSASYSCCPRSGCVGRVFFYRAVRDRRNNAHGNGAADVRERWDYSHGSAAGGVEQRENKVCRVLENVHKRRPVQRLLGKRSVIPAVVGSVSHAVGLFGARFNLYL